MFGIKAICFKFIFKVPLLIVLEQVEYYRWHTAGSTTGFTDLQAHQSLDKQLFCQMFRVLFLFRFKTCLEVNCNVLRSLFVSERYASCSFYLAIAIVLTFKTGWFSSVEFILLDGKHIVLRLRLLCWWLYFFLSLASWRLFDRWALGIPRLRAASRGS